MPASHSTTFLSLSPARRRLLCLMQELNFGRIEGLSIRRVAVLERPAEALIFPGALFELLASPPKAAATLQKATSPKRGGGDRTGASAAGRLDVPGWLADRGIAFRTKDGVDAKGRTTYVLANCPFDPSHADPDACVMQDGEGALSAKCFHNSCADRGW